MIEGQEQVVLQYISLHSLSYHAIKLESNLLPLIASITEEQCKVQTGKMSADETTFPPKDLVDKKDKQKFKAALSLQDHYLPYKQIKSELKGIRSIFNPVQEAAIDEESANYDLEIEEQHKSHHKMQNMQKDNQKSNQVKKIDSTSYLPQISNNSSLNDEGYESSNSDGNKIDQNTQKKIFSNIEEINVEHKKIVKLTQEQLKKQKILANVFSSSDNEEEEGYEEESENKINTKPINVKANDEYYSNDKENDEYEEDMFDQEIEEEEEEIENQLGDDGYEYEYDYEDETVITQTKKKVLSPQALS